MFNNYSGQQDRREGGPAVRGSSTFQCVSQHPGRSFLLIRRGGSCWRQPSWAKYLVSGEGFLQIFHFNTFYLSSKKSFGVVQFKETMAVKRALQNPRHYINEQFVEIALSKFAIEAFLSPSTLWVWDLAWAITKEDLIQYFSKFGKVYRAMHIYNPITGMYL